MWKRLRGMNTSAKPCMCALNKKKEVFLYIQLLLEAHKLGLTVSSCHTWVVIFLQLWGRKTWIYWAFFPPSLFGDNRKLVTTFSIRCVRGNCVLLTSFLVASKYFKMAKHLSLPRCGCFARLTRRLLGKTHKRFIRGVNGTASVYDPNYHLCFSAYFNHGHIPLPLSRVQHTLSRHRQTVELELNNG